MYPIKVETEVVLCHGCLSADRKLSPLTNYEMYFTILGNKQTLEEYKYLNILLCWECQALLRRMQQFRNTLQRAEYMLPVAVAHVQQISPNTLSTLNSHYKQNYDCVIEESIEAKPDIQIIIDNIDIAVKEESLDNLETDNFDTFSDNCKEENLVKNNPKKKVYKKDREKREIKKIDNKLDLNNPDKYFSQVRLSERDIEETLEREKREGNSRPHACNICGFWFANNKELFDHTKSVHKQRVKSVKCVECALTFKALWDLELHCWRSHPVNRCAVCGRIVAQARDRAKHLLIHRFKYRCLKCEFDFSDKQWFKQHEAQLHSNYTCDHCNYSTHTKNRLEKHIVRHHLPNKCPTCHVVLGSWERLRRHARDAHERAGPAYCVECDRSFATPAKYSRHLSQSARHRPKKKISVPCPECGKVFSRKNYMNNHIKLFHSNQSRHHCPLCDKYFVNGWGLRTHHKFVHEKIPMPKNKICTVCGRGFATNRVLENHMRTHTGERPFSCAHCAAAFAQRVALKAHLVAIHKQK